MSFTDKPFRAMLAFDAPLEYYQNADPTCWLMSRKLDGIRAVVRNGQLLSRTLKRIPNKYTQGLFGRSDLEGLDGELIVGEPSGEGVFARTSSGVMSFEGTPNVTFHIVDYWNSVFPFSYRMNQVFDIVSHYYHIIPQLTVVKQIPVENLSQILELEELFLAEGYEGAILKNKFGLYKFGRSTKREAGMGKLKRFEDREAVIIGFEELMHNDNQATRDARGLTTRGSSQTNQRPGGVLGTLRVRDVNNAAWEFGVGSGLDSELRRHIWNNRSGFLGKTITYKFLPIGTVDLPRHPIFKGFRSPIDV